AGLVQFWPILGNSAHPEWASRGGIRPASLACRSVSRESRVSEQLQPMCMALGVQQFGRAFVDAFGVFTTQIAAMVEEELQQRQVIVAEVTAQKEVAAQAAVEVLDQRTGPDGTAAYFVPRPAGGGVTGAQDG